MSNALHTTFTHAHENLLWASRSRSSRHTFHYELVHSPNLAGQVSSIWRIPTVSRHEKLFDYHPTQKPLRLVRRTLLASTREGDLVFAPFTGFETTAAAAKELNRAFVGVELEEEYTWLAAQRISATKQGSLLRDISEQFWSAP